MKINVSIIVPVYNSKKYLHYCLNSLVKQTFNSIEIILVDDGSTDGSYDICLAYKSKYSNIKVFKTKHHGVSFARNLGINKSEGNYICFVDSDDWLPNNAIELLYNNIINNNSDICWGSIKTIWPHINNTVKTKDSFYSLNDKKDVLNIIYNMHESSCSRVYKKEIINKHLIRFDENIKNGEDSVFIHNYLSKINKISTISDVVYFYNKLEKNTSVSRYHDDLYKWRVIELKARLEAYKKWANNDIEYNSISNNRINYFINEIINYYNDEDVNVKDIQNKINYFIKHIKEEYEMNDRNSMLIEQINCNQTIEKTLLKKTCITKIAKKILYPYITISRRIKVAYYSRNMLK